MQASLDWKFELGWIRSLLRPPNLLDLQKGALMVPNHSLYRIAVNHLGKGYALNYNQGVDTI